MKKTHPNSRVERKPRQYKAWRFLFSKEEMGYLAAHTSAKHTGGDVVEHDTCTLRKAFEANDEVGGGLRMSKAREEAGVREQHVSSQREWQ